MTFTWLSADDNTALYSVAQEDGNDMRGMIGFVF